MTSGYTNGLRTSLSTTVDGTADFSNNYVYDGLGRMTQVIQTGAGIQDKQVDLTYDTLGRFQTIERFNDSTGSDEVATSTYTYNTAGLNLPRRKNTTAIRVEQQRDVTVHGAGLVFS